MARIFQAAYFASFIAEILVRVPRTPQLRRTPKVDRRVSGVEITITAGLLVGMFLIPLAQALTPWLAFADLGWPAAIRAGMGVLGVAVLTFGMWLFWRAHRDIGPNWSPSLEISAGHRLVTDGVYSAVRHPMYACALAGALAQALLLQNWIAGLSGLAAFLAFYPVRVPAEERMMIDHFGDAYRAYAARTGRLLPRVSRGPRARGYDA